MKHERNNPITAADNGMHEAERYLRNESNPTRLRIIIGKKKRTLFINREIGVIGILAPNKRNQGYVFTQWNDITKVCYPLSPVERNKKLVKKYQRMAAKATFTNPYLRKVAEAVQEKNLYENRISTGVPIEGEVISLKAIRKWCGEYVYHKFKQALKEKKSYTSNRFRFRGYEGTLWLTAYQEGDKYMNPGDIHGGFNRERKNCSNGYYYVLINDDNFIGYDID